MPVQFINPAGRRNIAILTAEGIEKLKRLSGYSILYIEGEKPKVRVYTGESVCVSCEG